MQCVACAFTGHCGKCGIIDSIDSPGRVLFDKVRQGSFGSVLSDLIFIAVGLNSANSLSGSSHHGVPASVAALALAAFAVWALGLRTVRRHRPVSVTGGAAARSRSTFSSQVEDFAACEIQRDRMGAGSHART